MTQSNAIYSLAINYIDSVFPNKTAINVDGLISSEAINYLRNKKDSGIIYEYTVVTLCSVIACDIQQPYFDDEDEIWELESYKKVRKVVNMWQFDK